MALLKYCDKHNQVGFLRKPTESTGFADIVDFLRGSHIRYALTHNPTIYDSLVKQFWQTATALTLANETIELRATIDNIEYTISKASIRSKLQLEDASGISMLPNTEVFEGMGHMGYPTDGTFTFWKNINPETKNLYLSIAFTKKIFGNMKRGFGGIPKPLLPAMLSVANPIAGKEGPSDISPPSNSTPEAQPVQTPISAPEQTTSLPNLEPTPEPTPITAPEPTLVPTPAPTPLPAPETTHIPESTSKLTPSPDVEPMEHTYVDALETELKQSKETMGKAIIKLVKKVKKLEVALTKRRVVPSESEDEEMGKDKSGGYETPKEGTHTGDMDISPQGLEAAETLAETLSQIKSKKRTDKAKERRRLDAKDVSTANFKEEVNTATAVLLVSTVDVDISTASRSVTYSRRSADKRPVKDKGKAIMTDLNP
ncbi:hypothetical protein Tco_0751603 [Tanacetum coccineum]|uniref:Xylulose kinase-1 n=1 Tax=Tanacetum coccineum TaxID=301880 RepID=A0ABQ4Z7Q6_9ASTR